MIQTNELRIGNWVKDAESDMNIKVAGLDPYEIFVGEIDEEKEIYDCRDIEPIPLTEDLLVQLGFPNEYATMYETSDGWFLHIDDASHQTAIAIPVKYLHELQNAYFVATKKELEVKL